jgi:hypothetical protein
MQTERCPNYDPDFEVDTVPFEFNDGYFVSGDIRIAIKAASDLVNKFPTALEWLEKPF